MPSTLGTWDYVVLSGVLFVSIAIGLYYRFTSSKNKTTKEYLLADRSMNITPVAFSLMTSFMSAITLLGVCMENYQYGTMFVIINISYVLCTPIIVYLILPIFYRLKTASVYEYLEMRFGYAARLSASLAYTIQMVLYMGIVLYAPALALEAVTGLDAIFSIVIIGVVCTIYSTLGGMRAVLVTDIYQSLLMFVAIFSVIICAVLKAGGFGEIWRVAQMNGRINFSNISIDPTERHTWYTQIIGGAVTYLAIYGVNQTQVQRMLSAHNFKAAQSALWWCLPILCLLSVSTCFSGLCIYWYYHHCDPLLDGRITSRDQLMPLFVVDTMSQYPGLSGLFVSGIFSASLSTISSAINSLAAVTLEDYFKPFIQLSTKRTLNDTQFLLYSKLLSLFYGAMCIGLAFLTSSIGGVLQAALSIFGVIGGPLLGLFTLGMYVTVANQKGAVSGLIVGLAFSFWICFGTPKPPVPTLGFSIEGCTNQATTSHVSEIFRKVMLISLETPPPESHYFYLYRISYMWYAVLGFLMTFIMGCVLSCCYAKLRWDSNANIYTNAERTMIKSDLFVPTIVNSLRRKNMTMVVITGTIFENGRINSLNNAATQPESAINLTA